ncbi:MAG: DEAD/DEAH box helicase [Candidatus Pacebacteria bacterium]|nr:DEAD/DEAH box helicase [Candidatus Paceibacterota bacterium]
MEQSTKGFNGLSIAPSILGVLEFFKFTTPTPIQERSIPVAIDRKDLIGIAQTGTGKTLAFGIPLLQFGLQGKRALVIVPTRELALQVGETLRKFGVRINVRTATLIGGEPMWRQLKDLEKKPQIIVGTPGRIIDHIERKTISFAGFETLVLDEADRMLDMGFAPQLKQILNFFPHERHTMLFSATMPAEIVKMTRAYMKLPVQIEMAPTGTTAKNVTHEIFFVAQQSKQQLLEKILYDYKGSVLVFCRIKYGVRRIAMNIRNLGHTVAEIHSNRSLNQRRDALEGFKSGKYRILIATDIAARGIDVKNIELVVNFDLPSTAEDYVHRIGRTARAGESGHAISFARPDEARDIRAIERLIKKNIPVSKLPELPPARVAPMSERSYHERSGRRPFSSNRSRKFPPRRGGSSGFRGRGR